MPRMAPHSYLGPNPESTCGIINRGANVMSEGAVDDVAAGRSCTVRLRYCAESHNRSAKGPIATLED